MRRRNRARAKEESRRLKNGDTVKEGYRCWRYHSEHEPKIFEGEEAAAAALEAGWKKSPAECEGFLDKVGVDADDKLLIQVLGNATADTVEAANLIENLATLTKADIFRLAEIHLGENWGEVRKRDTLDTLRTAMTEKLAELKAQAE